MNPKRHLIDQILSWAKTIESRWYKTKRAPWNKIKIWETVYFKDSSKVVSAKAKISDIKQFEDLDKNMIHHIIQKYWNSICLPKEELEQRTTSKNYCILVFLAKPKSVVPFHIDKTWFGNGNAWLCVEDIKSIII